MRRLSLVAVAAISTLAFAQITSAADLPVKAPVIVPPPAYSWTGFYVGANIGGGWGTRNVDYSANDPGSASVFRANNGGMPPAISFRTSGVLGGLQVGYNWQFVPTWLIGLETDFDWSGMKGSGSSGGTLQGTIPYTATVDENIKWFGTVRARLGYLPAPNLLAYVTGGFAYGHVEHTGNYNNLSGTNLAISVGGFTSGCAPGTTCFTGSSSSVGTGWTLGGGLEYAVARNWILKTEYLYVSLGSNSITESATAFTPGTTPVSFNANYSRTSFNVARVGLNYRF